MSGTWYPRLNDQLEAERLPLDDHSDSEDGDWDIAIDDLPASAFGKLVTLRDRLRPLDYDELGWGD